MNERDGRWKSRSLVAGIALGGVLAAVRSRYLKRHPEATVTQWLIDRALTKTLQKARAANRIELGPESKYVVFSDHHKGGGDKADDFRQCENTYLAALEHYFKEGYTLIVMGDAEELWEEEIERVMDVHEGVFVSEARFHPDRYIRIHGNHDDPWRSPRLVKQYLDPLFRGIEFIDGLVFAYSGDADTSGEIFLVHGHQGTVESDLLAFMGRLSLPVYREFQNRTGLGRTTPAEDACLRAEHDSQMYRWASQQGKLILVAGHTHRPVWSSRTHVEKLYWELVQLRQERQSDPAEDLEEKIANKQQELREKEKKYPPCTDTIKTRPCYLNTGCCRFEDGDITGIELHAEEIRLIKWGKENCEVARTQFESARYSDLFFFL